MLQRCIAGIDNPNRVIVREHVRLIQDKRKDLISYHFVHKSQSIHGVYIETNIA